MRGSVIVGQETQALANQTRGSVLLPIVFEGNGFFLRLCLAGGCFLRHTKGDGVAKSAIRGLGAAVWEVRGT